MSKPNHGTVWLHKCPNCGNMKSTFYSKDNVDKCKCTKCGYKYEVPHCNIKN